MSVLCGGLNRSTQHFILEGKMECSDGSGISSRVHGAATKVTPKFVSPSDPAAAPAVPRRLYADFCNKICQKATWLNGCLGTSFHASAQVRFSRK